MMDERDWLAEQFEDHRSHLWAVAYRMLGSVSDADDAVQEAWLRLCRADTTYTCWRWFMLIGQQTWSMRHD